MSYSVAPLLLLIGRFATSTAAACNTTAENPYVFLCGSEGRFDLTGFKKATPATGYYHAVDSEQHDYFFEACGWMTKITCQNSQAQGPIAFQTWGQPPPQPPQFPADSCAALGAFSTEMCHATNGTLSCDFTNGDGGRSASVSYQCGPTYQQPTAAQPDPQDSHYVLTLMGPAGCPQPVPPPPPSPPAGIVAPQQVTWLYANSLGYGAAFLSDVVGFREIVGLKQSSMCRIFAAATGKENEGAYLGVCDTRKAPSCPDGPEGAGSPPLTYTLVVANRAAVDSWHTRLAKGSPAYINVTKPSASEAFGVYAFNFYDRNMQLGLGCYRFEVQAFDTDPAWPQSLPYTANGPTDRH
jgi:hypothetical protein